MVKKVYLIRHGHIDTGEEKRYVGRTDIPLDALGKEQVKSLGHYFESIHIDMLFTSPLTRCMQTAFSICEPKQLTPCIIDSLQEIDMGTWENLPMKEIKQRNPKAFEQRGEDIEHFTPKGGESFSELSNRVLKAFKYITTTSEGTIAIVAHAGVNRVIIRSLLGMAFNDIFTIEQPYTSIYEIKLGVCQKEIKCARIR
jgi:probable phosphoglycerate mutase